MDANWYSRRQGVGPLRGVVVLFAIALASTGCKTQPPPATDPFNSRYVVPPPATGSCSPAAVDPGYQARPGLPGNSGGALPTGALPTITAPNAISGSGSMPSGTAGAAWTPANSLGSRSNTFNVAASPANTTPANTTPANTSLANTVPTNTLSGSPGVNSSVPNSNVSAANGVGAGQPNYGLLGNGATGGAIPPTNTSATGVSGYGTSTPGLIPPPGTVSPGGYPNPSAVPVANPASNLPANPPANSLPGTGAAPQGGSALSAGNQNQYGPAGNYNPAGTTRYGNPDAVPRPTPSMPAATPVRPAASIPGGTAIDRSPRPVDDAGTGSKSQGTSYSNVPTNSTTSSISLPAANPSNRLAASPQPTTGVRQILTQSRTMPIAPTAYQNPNAAPPYCASIQPISVEPDWEPCDDYADDGE